MDKKITIQQLDDYIASQQEQARENVRMYWELAVNGKTYTEIGAQRGMTGEGARKRIKSMIGYINNSLDR